MASSNPTFRCPRWFPLSRSMVSCLVCTWCHLLHNLWADTSTIHGCRPVPLVLTAILSSFPPTPPIPGFMVTNLQYHRLSKDINNYHQSPWPRLVCLHCRLQHLIPWHQLIRWWRHKLEGLCNIHNSCTSLGTEVLPIIQTAINRILTCVLLLDSVTWYNFKAGVTKCNLIFESRGKCCTLVLAVFTE